MTDNLKRTAFVLMVIATLLFTPYQLLRAQGVVMLVGDVLPLKNQVVWRNLVRIAERKSGENVIIAAAHSRPKLYGGFTGRAFQRYGASSQLLPIAEVFQEFSTDYRFAAEDRIVTDQVRDSSSIFFVGGLPQRLSRIMFSGEDTAPSDLASAVREAHAAGSMVIGGIPGATVLSTETDPIEVLNHGRIGADHLVKGLNLVDPQWFVDQHYFGNGRFATGLVAMHQTGARFGIGVGLDTAAVLHSDIVEVLGNRGVMIVDLSDAEFSDARHGVTIRRVQLSYLENGDRFEMQDMNTIPYQEKLNGFEMLPHVNASESVVDDRFVSSQEVFTRGEIVRLMVESLEAKTGQSLGYALHHDSRDGFQFRFYTGPDSKGWWPTDDSGDHYTLSKIYLDIEPLSQD
ncbi:MAG: hypothetical protein OXI60_01655 [Acidiferrobacterales bacterium]|nr:hypothetical protein [Acidiferrobacterales bacterium]